jgi:predicted ribonuclease YlaK
MAIKKRTKLAKVDTQSIIGSRIDFKKREFNFTEKQQEILKCLLHDDTKIVFLSGYAGTSKTWLSVYAALHLIDRDFSRDIIYIRSLIESASKSLGYLPGSEEEKFSPFLIPLLDKCDEIINDACSKQLIAADKISSSPINFLRGQNFRNKIILVDEAQNISRKELITIISRMAEGSKMFILGDLMQTDLPDGVSGLADFIKVFDNEESRANGIFNFSFGKEDIVRSKLLRFILEKIEQIPAMRGKHL